LIAFFCIFFSWYSYSKENENNVFYIEYIGLLSIALLSGIILIFLAKMYAKYKLLFYQDDNSSTKERLALENKIFEADFINRQPVLHQFAGASMYKTVQSDVLQSDFVHCFP